MAGKKKGCVLVLLLIVGGVLFGANYWIVEGIESGIREAILEETDFPPVLKGFTGVLPTGQFSADYLEAKTRVEENLLEVRSTDISLRLDPVKYVRERYEIRDLGVDSLVASYAIPEEDLSFQGRFEIDAESTEPGPALNPPGSLWTERLEIRLNSLDAKFRNRDLKLLNQAKLVLLPVNILPEEGLSGETQFDFEGQLTPDKDANLIRIHGQHHSDSGALKVDASLRAIQFPSTLDWVNDWLAEYEGVNLADIVKSGSASYRIAGLLEGDLFQGEMTLRVHRPRFGPALRELAEDYPVSPLLDLLERQNEVIQLGPIPIDEDLSTPFIESGGAIIGGLTTEFFKLSAKQEGGNVIDFFRKSRGSSSDSNGNE